MKVFGLLNGVIAFNLRPKKWRWGLEMVRECNGVLWRWMVLGPIALNLGAAGWRGEPQGPEGKPGPEETPETPPQAPRPRPDVVMINRTRRVAVLSDNSIVPVTHWFDRNAEECEPEEAVYCVTGKDGVGWYHVDLQEYRYAEVH